MSLDVYDHEGFRVASELYRRAAGQQQVLRDTTWLGLRALQLPEDLVAMQELVWALAPDVIIETGVAYGGSVIFYASLLELLGRGRVVGIDVRFRRGVRKRIATHPLGHRVSLIEASSTDGQVIDDLREAIEPDERVLVVLDADHSYDHVSQELELYSELVTPGSYLVATDGVMEVLSDAPAGQVAWATDNPARAARDFLARHPEFSADPHYERFGPTFFPGGYLRRSDGS